MREGHEISWYLPEPEGRQPFALRGLIPPPLEKEPDYSQADLVVFDSTGNAEYVEEIRKVTPVIGNGALNTKLEDDRMFGLNVMEACGIEVPFHAQFTSPEQAKSFIQAKPKRYVYKPSTPPSADDQDLDTTYVSENAEDLLRCIDQLFADSQNAPFVLQEFVEGCEVSTEAWFDGTQFYLHNHTWEEKKFMNNGYGPNHGCSGNLVWVSGPTRLFSHGLGKMLPFLRDMNYRGMIDLNAIVNENHVYGLEYTPRIGLDATPTLCSLLDGDLGQFLLNFAAGPVEHDPVPRLRANWAASARYSIPPYPEEKAAHPKGVPVKGITLEDAWLNFYLHDAMLDRKAGQEELCTAGIDGFVGAPIASGHTAEGAWEGVERLTKKLKIPNMQVRTDLKSSTIRRVEKLECMGWLL